LPSWELPSTRRPPTVRAPASAREGSDRLTWAAARLIAPTQDVSTARWTTGAALGEAISDYGTVLFWVSSYAVLGTALAVAIRSVPVALAVGIAWAGPVEHLVQEAWLPATRWFPGLLLEAFVAGGTPEVTAARAFVTVAAFVVVAAALAGTSFSRRDVTA
jgi:ABC-2 type transport system permease protein